ncbi:hypothetical protein CMUS01_14006, partial [Colletotrichum musicola]
YEARKLEVEAELDYTKLAEDVKQGRLLEIFCLAVSDEGMLLLRRSDAAGAFQRIGVGFGYRRDFFKGVERAEVEIE